MHSSDRRVLVIGLDGGTYDVFRPLMTQGRMPNLAAFIERSSWGELESTVPPFTASAWSTFITGQNPGQHGILSFQTRDRFNYDTTGSGFVTADQFDQTIWQILSDAGKRVSVINVPMTYPPRPVHGYMITGMLTPSIEADFVYPLDLRARIDKDYIIDVDFIRDGADFRMHDFPAKAEMIRAIRQMTAVQLRTVLDLWRNEEPWDFGMVVFTGTDRLFHFFWSYVQAMIDHLNPSALPQWLDADIFNAVQIYVTELDEAIGALIEAAGPDTTVFMMSDHGFGPAQNWRAYLNIWLEQQGLLARRPPQGLFDLEYLRVLVGRQPWLKALLRRLLPQTVQDSATNVARSSSDSIIDWARTKAFFVPIYFQICGIEINQKGIFRQGIVEPGDAYEHLRDQIIDAAQQIRHPATRTPVVQRACRREDLYTGPHVQNFPDVILVLDPSYVGASSMAGKLLIEDHPHPMRSGEHLSNGMFAAASAHLKRRGEIHDLRLLDVPPTILYEMGVPIPESFDGRVITELYDQAYLDAHSITFQSVLAQAPYPERDLSAEEHHVLEERLRGLGYI